MNTLQINFEPVRFSAGDSLKPINFYCAAPRAKSVALVGDFNHWYPFPMQRSVDGWWSAQVQLVTAIINTGFWWTGDRCWIHTPRALPAMNGMNRFR